VASIWLEIWGVWIRVKKIDFLSEFPKISISFQAISHTKIRFFQANFRKILIFLGNFTKNFDFTAAKIGHLQLLLGKLFYFSSEVTTFEHTSCT